MYLVVSYWEVLPGHEEATRRVAPIVDSILRRQPGVVLVEAFESNGKYITVHGYESEAAYRAVLDNPMGEFNRAILEHRVEEMARWVSSERGETLPHV